MDFGVSMLIINKKALVALAAYLEATSTSNPLTQNERAQLKLLVAPCIDDKLDYVRYYVRWLVRGEVFFRSVRFEGTYIDNYNGRNAAKLLRYIATHSKFPRNRSLKYVP